MAVITDCLVIGNGVAGLTFALKAATFSKVLVIAKSGINDTNTAYAQGGIAGVFSGIDSFEKHISDTLVAGDGLCKQEVVQLVIENGPRCIKELIELGANFDLEPNGNYALGKEGGHSENRILHSQDSTGQEIQRTLNEAVLKHPNITYITNWFAVDLITQHHLGQYINRGNPDISCFGSYVLDVKTKKILTVLAKSTILATGGLGSVYANTTNPVVATGDGFAMALRAKARLGNMEFCQFHPTALYQKEVQPAFLITEALRGKGSILKNPVTLEPFMYKYDSRENLAPRDIVARAIDSEMKLTGYNFVYLDSTHLDHDMLKKEFPNIYNKCREIGLDLTKDLVPVVPAAHYMCGGIEVNSSGETNIHQLYACGECAFTGLHGANRLASNSLLEGLVYANLISDKLKSRIHTISLPEDIPDWNELGVSDTEEWVLISHNLQEVQKIMSNYVGIVRSNKRLDRAERRISLIYAETETFYKRTKLSPELCELRNIVACAYLIIKCSKIRKESRGLHFTTDYPDKLKNVWNTLV